MRGIVISLVAEAEEFIDKSYKRAIEDGFWFYVRDDEIVIASGVGKVNAQIATNYLIGLGCSSIINISSAVAMNENYKIGDVVVPDVFYDGDFDMSEKDYSTKDPAMVNKKFIANATPCYTYSSYNIHRRAEKGIVDMEAYAVVAQAQAYAVPCKVIKIITADPYKDDSVHFGYWMEERKDEIRKEIEELS